ncbi:MAG: hypothetical protein ACRDTD_07300 [Pseudonocardiaceae bacterium]
MEQHYATVRLTDAFQADVRRQLDDTVLGELGSIDALKKRLTTRLNELDTKEEQYLDLIGEPGWPKAKLQKKLHAIASERAEIEGQLADTASKLDTGRQFFLTALELLRDPQAFYRRGSASIKHALTKVIFAKLYLDMQDIALVSGHDLGEGLGDLIEAEERKRTSYRRSDTLSGWEDDTWNQHGWNDNRPFDAEGPALDTLTGANLLAWAVMGQGSSRGVLVEILTTYSHSTQAADLRLCHTEALTSPVCAPRPSAKRPWRLRDRLDERGRVVGRQDHQARHPLLECQYLVGGLGELAPVADAGDPVLFQQLRSVGEIADQQKR